MAYDGVLMTMKGFRAYFHAINSDQSSVSVLFDSPEGIEDSVEGGEIQTNAGALFDEEEGTMPTNPSLWDD